MGLFNVPTNRLVQGFPILLLLLGVVPALAQGPRRRIVASVDENRLVKLTRNTHRRVEAATELEAAPADLPLNRMILVLKGSPEQQTALTGLLEDQHEPQSPNYHQWLTPEEFGRRFGPANEDIQAVRNWLESHGFRVDQVARGRMSIEFSGTAGQVEKAFRTSIRRLDWKGSSHLANVSDPYIPEALSPVVVGISTLHDFRAKPQLMARPEGPVTYSKTGVDPAFNLAGGSHVLAPADLATIYNINAAYQAGIDGTGVTIGVIGRSNISLSDIADFRSFFSLPSTLPQVIVNGPDPGNLHGGEEYEAILDVSWSGAMAPGATVKFVVSQSTATTDGVDLSESYIINNNLAAVMTESFGDCEANYTASQAAFISSMAQQAAAQGITYMVSSGDSGSAGCDDPNQVAATNPVSVNMLASSPYVIAVGGTQFNDNGVVNYWSAQNGAGRGSALSYIPENVWNLGCANCGLWSSGGGVSTFFSKPSWQAGVAGIPNDGKRDLPDVSLTAATHDPYAICLGGSCRTGQVMLLGGTSASAPAFAGIMALVNQKTQSRQGQANTVLYRLAAQQQYSQCDGSNTVAPPASTCVFYDTTVGGNSVPGTPGYGTASASYLAGPGYDLASGLGSVNVANLLNAWAGAGGGGTLPFGVAATPSSGSVVSGVAKNLKFSWASPAGQPPLTYGYVLIQDPASGSTSVTNGCYLRVIETGAVQLADDSGTFSNGNTFVSQPWASSPANSHCQLNGPASSALLLTNGNGNLEVTLNLQFAAAWAGKTLAISLQATNVNYKSGSWQQLGTLAVTGAAVPSFTLSATAASVVAGASGTSTVTVTPVNGFNSAVTLAASNWPAGITGTFGTNPTTGTSAVTINVASTVVAGSYSLTVNGTSGALTASNPIALTVTAAAVPSFTLSATAATAVSGASGSSTATVNKVNGFNSAVTLASSNWPVGITGTFGTNPTAATATVTINVASSVTAGSYSLTVNGTSGALTASTTIALIVTAAAVPSFTLSATAATVVSGASGSSTVTVNKVNGFNAAVTLAASSWPAGITGTFATNPTAATSTVTINVASSVTAGSYSLTVNGTSGALTATTTIALNVTAANGNGLPFGVSVTPSAGSVPANAAQNLQLSWASPAGQAALTFGYLLVQDPAAGTTNAANGCYLRIVENGAVQLADDTGSFTFGNSFAGQPWASSPANSHCQLNGPASSALQLTSGNNNMQVTLNVQFGAAWAGKTLALSLQATNVNYKTGTWQQLGTLAINGAGVPSFTLSATPVTIQAGATGTSTVTVNPANGFNAAVTLAASAWPAGITGTFTTSTASISVASTVVAGSYALTVNGTSGALTASTTINLTVTAASSGTLPYGVSVTPSTASVAANAGLNLKLDWASPTGQPALTYGYVLIQDPASGPSSFTGGCYLRVVETGAAQLADDSGAFTNGNSFVGQSWASTPSNSHCQLNGLASSTVVLTNNNGNMEVTLNVQFTSSWIGKTLAVSLLGTNVNYKSGSWSQLGTVAVH